jgi:hypothetical protein
VNAEVAVLVALLCALAVAVAMVAAVWEPEDGSDG